MYITTIAAAKSSRPHRRFREQTWGNPEDELLGGARAWGSGDGSGSRSASENGGSIRVLNKAHDRQKLVAIRGENDRDVYNDTRLSRAQPWRSRYPTPHGLKEQLVQSHGSSTGECGGAEEQGKVGSVSVWDVEDRW